MKKLLLMLTLLSISALQAGTPEDDAKNGANTHKCGCGDELKGFSCYGACAKNGGWNGIATAGSTGDLKGVQCECCDGTKPVIRCEKVCSRFFGNNWDGTISGLGSKVRKGEKRTETGTGNCKKK